MKIPSLPLKLWLLVGGGLASMGGAIFFGGLVHFSSASPSYCLTCHSGNGDPEITYHSMVHPNVDCVSCHTERGGLIGKIRPANYSAKPELVSSNCLRCHENVLRKDGKVSYKFNTLNIRIPHRFHIEDIGARCTDCHRNIMHEKSNPVTNRPHRDYCFECHAQEDGVGFCRTCHPKGVPYLKFSATSVKY